MLMESTPMFRCTQRVPKRDSFVRPRPLVMLVRIERGAVPCELGLDELGVDVVHVRHPLPACERMRVLRPAVVIVHAEVRAHDAAYLKRAASEIGAKTLQLGSLLALRGLRDWVSDAIEEVSRRRSQDDEARKAAAQGLLAASGGFPGPSPAERA
jgi:hypothetical protein